MTLDGKKGNPYRCWVCKRFMAAAHIKVEWAVFTGCTDGNTWDEYYFHEECWCKLDPVRQHDIMLHSAFLHITGYLEDRYPEPAKNWATG